MAKNVRNIIDEIFADSDSEGEENFEGFDLEDFGPVEIERNQDNSNFDVLNEDLWASGDRTPHLANLACVRNLMIVTHLLRHLNFLLNQMTLIMKTNSG